MATRVGGGKAEVIEFITHGEVRKRVRAREPVEEHLPVVVDPTAPVNAAAITFFRDRGDGKFQYCVQFPSGAIQVIATEP